VSLASAAKSIYQPVRPSLDAYGDYAGLRRTETTSGLQPIDCQDRLGAHAPMSSRQRQRELQRRRVAKDWREATLTWNTGS
jgi:hypothetical protein